MNPDDTKIVFCTVEDLKKSCEMVKKSCKINIKESDAERFIESGVFI